MTTLAAPLADQLQQRFLIRDADWETYQLFLKARGPRRYRITYDRGRLELMTTSFGHERSSALLGQFVEVITDELDLPRQSGGATTFQREDLDRGLEPDRCYYLDNEPLVREKDEIDLEIDPPPDLAIEVEVSRSALNRFGIYAAIKVPELWRYDGDKLHVYWLNDQGEYEEKNLSRNFPFLPLAEVEAFLKKRHEMSETHLMRAFRLWVRQQRDAWKK